MKRLKLNIQLFGASASNSTTLTASSGNKGTLSTSFVENSSDTNTNKSNITVTATFKMTSGGYSQYNTPRVEIWWYDNNGYSTITRKAYTEATSLSRNQSVTATATFDVDHKADGTLSGYARANWVYSGGYPYCPPSGEVATGDTALTTILRGITEISSITCSTSYIDGTFTVTANPQASGKYYKIEWYIINQSGNKYTICTDNLGTFATGSRTIQSKTFTSTQLTNIYTNCTNTANPTLYAVVHTYNDSGYTSEILSTAPKTISINLPTSVKPSGSVTITDTVTKPSGLTSYVRSISKPKFTISITNNNGATISSCVIKLNGSQIKAFDNAATSYTYTHTETLPNVSNTYEVVATDTRNRQYIATGTITALDYSAPSVHFTAERNSTTDTTINLIINGSITSLSNKNAKSYLIQKKLSSSTTWTNVTTLTSYTYTNYAYDITNCSADDIFDIKITATDSFGSSADSTQVGTSFSLMDFKQGGKGIAFGKAATTDNLFECAIDADFTGALKKGGANLLELIFPVGSVYTSSTNTNPSTTLGFGTWGEIPCHEVIKNATITGTGINTCRYRIFADGTFELEAITTSYDLNARTAHSVSITFPYTITNAVCVAGITGAGNYYADTERFSQIRNNNTIYIESWNNATGTANALQDCVIVKGTLNLANSGLTTLYRFKRTN